jgi:hypothetical protein
LTQVCQYALAVFTTDRLHGSIVVDPSGPFPGPDWISRNMAFWEALDTIKAPLALLFVS